MLILSLSSASPPRIEDASSSWCDHFGFELATCRGRTLSLVCGPESNPKTISNLIETALNGQQTQARLVLYTSSGVGALFNVHAQPSSCFQRCELALTRCDALSFEEAAHEDGTVKVLLHARKPFKVAHVSAAFASAYGFAPEVLVNRTLGLIQGPGTDANAWNATLVRALEGHKKKARLQTYTCNGAEIGRDMTKVSVTPIMQGGDVGYLLVAMGNCKNDKDKKHDFSAEAVTRRVTFTGDTCEHNCESRRIRPVSPPAARPEQSAAPKRKASDNVTMHTVRLACARLQAHKAAKHRKEMRTQNRMLLRQAQGSILMAVFSSILMVISSILYFMCDDFWALESSSSPSGTHSHKTESSNRDRSCSSAPSETYRRDWQRLHFIEMSDDLLADFSPY